MSGTGNGGIAVLGAGISGLVCALRLAEQGRRVTVIDSAREAGGLGTFFEHGGRTFEKFYHCMLPTDDALLAVLDSLGLKDEVYWRPSSFAYADGGRIFPLNQPRDLLAFAPLPLADRIRVGVTGVWGRIASAKGLDEITTAEWLLGLSGKRAFDKFWRPMLEAKFGDRYAEVPALWFWTRFNREKGSAKGEVKGYMRGGYKRIIDAFARRLRELGVTLRLGEEVVSLDLEDGEGAIVNTATGAEHYGKVVATLPWPALSRVAGPRLRQRAPETDWGIDFQGVINHVLFLRRSLSRHYWLATPGADFPFDGVVETSTLTDESDRGEGRHVVYLTKYLHRGDARFAAAEDEIKQSFRGALRGLFTDLRDEDFEAEYLFRAAFVEPVYTRGYLRRRPPEVLVPGQVYLATTAQVYPTVTSWNGSVQQAEKTLAAMAA